MPIQGLVRLRKKQIGKQSAFASNTGAVRAYPYRGPIIVEPNSELPDVDMGSLDPIMGSFLGAQEITASLEGKAAFNDLPLTYAGAIKGGVSPTGAVAKTWTFQAASLTADDFDYFTCEYADDTTDTIIAGGGVIDGFSLSFGEDLAAFDLTQDWLFARAELGNGITGGLTVDETPNWTYGAHTVVYLDSVPGSIGITPIVDAIHGVEFTVANALDQKRFANGSNAGFNLAGYGRGAREITLVLTVAKTAAMIAEGQTIDDVPRPTRYFDLKTTSTEMVTGSTPFTNSIRFPAELISREEGEVGNNNAVLTLTYRGRYDSTLGYALRAVVVCETASL